MIDTINSTFYGVYYVRLRSKKDRDNKLASVLLYHYRRHLKINSLVHYDNKFKGKRRGMKSSLFFSPNPNDIYICFTVIYVWKKKNEIALKSRLKCAVKSRHLLEHFQGKERWILRKLTVSDRKWYRLWQLSNPSWKSHRLRI